MEISYIYKVINKKEKSIKDFIEFVDFMFENKNNIEALKNQTDKENFEYHFEKIPIYMRDVMQKLRYDLIGDISNISATTEMLSERVDKFTDLK